MDDGLFEVFPVRKFISDGVTTEFQDLDKSVIQEISLKVYINGEEYASLLCMNQMIEEFALGFLYSEGVIDFADEVKSVWFNDRMIAVMIELVPGKTVEKCESIRSMTSGCGRCFTYINPVKGEKFKQSPNNIKFHASNIVKAMRKFEEKSDVFRVVGAVHSAYLSNDEFSFFSEDIGRHNCIDKIAGAMLKGNKMKDAGNSVVYISGRISSEIIIKIIRLNIPVIVSRAAPTAAAVTLARKYNTTLVGYVRDNTGIVYSGNDKII